MKDATTQFTLTKLLDNNDAIMTTVKDGKTEEPLSIIPTELQTGNNASQPSGSNNSDTCINNRPQTHRPWLLTRTQH